VETASQSYTFLSKGRSVNRRCEDAETDNFSLPPPLSDPIEREIRRRIFFLLFCADKSESVLLGRPVKMREEDCFTLRLPEEL
jgi:hypothetical protein